MGAWLRKPTWWKAALAYGTAMFVIYAGKHVVHGDLTLPLLGKEFLIWESAGVVFGVIFTAVMSLLARKNLFHGFPERKGGR
jgi:hypothetical protein